MRSPAPAEVPPILGCVLGFFFFPFFFNLIFTVLYSGVLGKPWSQVSSFLPPPVRALFFRGQRVHEFPTLVDFHPVLQLTHALALSYGPLACC